MQTILYFASILLTGALSGFLAAYAWRQRSVPGSHAYAGLALGECLLALAEILSMLSPTQALALFWWQVRYLFLAAIPVFWLVFALEYSGRKDWLSKRLLAGMFIVPAITQIMLWSNNLHGLWVRQEAGLHQTGPFWIADTGARLPGLGFLAHSFYGLILLLIGIVLLLVAAWRMRRQYRGQALVVAGAACTAFAFALVATLNLIPRTEFNPFTPGIGLSVLLIALAVFRFQFLKRAPAAEAGSKAQALESQAGRSLAVFLFIFLLMATGIAAVGYLSFQNYESRFRAQVESQLVSIAELKVDGLENWRAERMGDAQAMRQNPAFAALAARYLENPADTQAQAQIQAWLDSLRSSYHYDRVFLLDTGGVEWISSPAAPEPVAAHLTREAAAILSAGQVTFLDFHRDTADGPIYLALLVPIFAEQEGNRPLGILVLRIDPSVYLYPYIQQWPVPSASAETLLVRREGTDALFLNELKFQANTALNLRAPLENTQLPAVQAALGQVGLVEGVDYRGVPVIAAVHAVPGSPWFLVARVDTAEVYAPLRERLWQTLIFFGALIAASGAGLMLVWRQQRVRYDREQVEAAQALQNSHALLAATLESTADGLLVVDRAGQVTSFNRKFLELWGIPESLAATRDDEQLLQFVLAQLQYPDAFLAKVEKLYQTPDASDLDELAFKDGRIFERYSQPQCHGDTVVGRVWSFRDITERKRAEEQLRLDHEIMTNINDGVYLVRVSDGVILFANRQFEKMFGYNPGELIGKHVSVVNAPTEKNPQETAKEIIEELNKHGIWRGEVLNVKKDGTAFWCDASVTSLTVESADYGAVWASVHHDITERKRQEAEILAAQAELQRLLAESDQSRRALLSVVEDQKKAEEEIRQLNAELEQRVRERTAQLQAANKQLESEIAERKGAEEALEGRVAELSALNAIAAIVTESLDVDEILNRAMDEALRLVGVEAAAMLLLDEKAGELALVAHRGISDEFVRTFSRLKLGEGLSGRVAQTGEPVIMASLTEYPAARRAYLEQDHIQSAVAIPMTGSTGVIGVMTLGAASPAHFDPAGIELLVAVGQQIAIGVEKARLHEAVQGELAERKRAEVALRESEERIRRLSEAAFEAIIIHEGGVLLSANDQYPEMFGYEPKELLGKQVMLLTIAPEAIESVRKEIATGGRGPYESIGLRKDGTKFPMEIRVREMEYGGREVRVAAIMDITERKRAEEALHQRTAQLQVANKELEAFAYSVSHDLRAPLRGIDGWSLALLEDCYAQLDDQARQYLDRVRSEAQRMGQLIDDLLQLSRVTRAEMRQGPADLSALAQTVVARLKEAQPERQVELVIQPGLTAHGDARLLEVALTNLLGNAWKFTGARQEARIEFGQTEVEGHSTFFVRDNGVGFDMAYAEKLFGAFQRMHRASEFPGAGIGLATVQRIVHRHGGRTWAEAHVDQGATFYFTLEEAA